MPCMSAPAEKGWKIPVKRPQVCSMWERTTIDTTTNNNNSNNPELLCVCSKRGSVKDGVRTSEERDNEAATKAN